MWAGPSGAHELWTAVFVHVLASFLFQGLQGVFFWVYRTILVYSFYVVSEVDRMLVSKSSVLLIFIMTYLMIKSDFGHFVLFLFFFFFPF